MKRYLVSAILCLAVCANVWAQQRAADSPATREDVEKYLEVVHSREMTRQMMEAMSKPMHKMVHDQFVKDKDKLPADFEDRMNSLLDEMLSQMPLEEMQQAMVPTYQKHFTKGDLDALVSFYGSPTGQKVLREMPAILAEGMEARLPVMQKQIEGITQRMQQEVAQMLKNSEKHPENRPATRQN